MAAYQSRSQHAGNGAGSLTSTITLAKPAGTVDGDYLIAVLVMIFGSSGLAVSSPPAGWTLLYSSGAVAHTGGFGFFYVYGKKAASEPASWAWGLNNSVAFYNCHAVRNDGVNGTSPYEQLSSTSTASMSAGGTLVRAATTTGPNETLLSIAMAANGSPSWTESAGTEQFESSFGNCDVAYNMLNLPSPATQSVTATLANPSGNSSTAMVQLAFKAVSVDATVVAPVAAATASAPVPSPVQGVASVAARATATGTVPANITGAQTVIVVPGIATASRAAPRARSTRIPLTMYPDVGGEIALVEDTP